MGKCEPMRPSPPSPQSHRSSSKTQFGNCLTLPHIGAFLLLTSLATIGIPIIAYPPSILIYGDLQKVLAWSYVDEYMRGAWWTRWYSWVPGPIGRWAIGITWGFWTYSEEVQRGTRAPSGFFLFLLTVGIAITFVALVSGSSVYALCSAC
jgi:hypothetical protein